MPTGPTGADSALAEPALPRPFLDRAGSRQLLEPSLDRVPVPNVHALDPEPHIAPVARAVSPAVALPSSADVHAPSLGAAGREVIVRLHHVAYVAPAARPDPSTVAP